MKNKTMWKAGFIVFFIVDIIIGLAILYSNFSFEVRSLALFMLYGIMAIIYHQTMLSVEDDS